MEKIMIDYLAHESDTDVTLMGIQYKNIDFHTEMTAEIQEAVNTLFATLNRISDQIDAECCLG